MSIMDPIKIFMENWSLVIATLALAVSLYSAYLSRKVFIHTGRPYVWASNYGVIDQKSKNLISIPHRLVYRIKNSPAKIQFICVRLTLGDQEILNHTEKNFVRFPDDSSEWSFSIGEDEFKTILEKQRSSSSQLLRNIFVKYTSLNGGEKYEYHLKQEFIPADNQWKDIESQS